MGNPTENRFDSAAYALANVTAQKRELDAFVSECRIQYAGINRSPEYVYAVVALSHEMDALQAHVDRLKKAMQRAADSFRSHGFAVDADELEVAIAQGNSHHD